MVPDVPLFAPWVAEYNATHSLVGVVSIDAALGLVVFVAWHVVFGPALAAAFRPALGHRLSARASGVRSPLWRWTHAPAVYASFVIGAMTHVGWDAFTHEGRWGTTHVRWLAQTHGPLTGAAYAQEASTVVGALVVAWWLHRWCAANGLALMDLRLSRGAQLVCLAVLFAGATNAALALAPELVRGELSGVSMAAFVVATRGISGGAVCAIVMAAGWHGRRLLRASQ
jgi:hypothetical protein